MAGLQAGSVGIACLTGTAPTIADTPEKMREWNDSVPAVIGQVRPGPGRADGFCTGTLVSPTLVLTAAHCAQGREPALTARQRRFFVPATGQEIRVINSAPHPRYREDGHHSADFDYGVLTLASPAPQGPLGMVFGTLRKEMTVLGYTHAHPGRVTGRPDCALKTVSGPALLLNCAVSGGLSGSPVFARQPGGPLRIVGVVSSRSSQGAWVARLDDWLRKWLN